MRRRGSSRERKNDPARNFADLHRQVTSGRRDDLVAGAVALGRAAGNALMRAGADVRGRLGIHQLLQHRRQHHAHQLATVGGAQRLAQLEQGALVPIVCPFYEVLGGFSQSLTRWPSHVPERHTPGPRSSPVTPLAGTHSDGGDLTRTRRLGAVRFEHAIRREITKRGGRKPCLRIVREMFAALADSAGVAAHRAGALERVQLLLVDWIYAHERLADAETRMVAVLDGLQVTGLVCSIPGISAVGPQRSWPRPATHAASPLRGPWSSTPVSRHARDCRATSRAGPSSPARADPGCGLPPSLGCPTGEPRLRGEISAPDHQIGQQAQADPGPGSNRCRDPAASACSDHHRPGLGPDHRHPWQ